MSSVPSPPPTLPAGMPAQPAWIVLQPPGRRWGRRLILAMLILSVLLNLTLFIAWGEYFSKASPPTERYHSGSRVATDKIALIKVHGTIMPPFTERLIQSIDRAREDKAVKGILLEIDSPGGLVADSHEIWRKLREINPSKPIAVIMKRIAASGGYYVAVAAGVNGRIFAEPTTWTGSIGVIIPRYDLSEISKKVGVAFDPLKTGELKDSMSPFRELSEKDREVWKAILDDAFDRFKGVIQEGRKEMTLAKLEPLADGRLFTADQAKANGLIDEIGFEDDALKWLNDKCGLPSSRVITYEHPVTFLDLALGASTPAKPQSQLEMLLEASVPRAFYYCSWGPSLPTLPSPHP